MLEDRYAVEATWVGGCQLERDVADHLNTEQHGEQCGDRPTATAQRDASGQSEAQQGDRVRRRRKPAAPGEVTGQRQAHRRHADR
jgi:hypothetical protein